MIAAHERLTERGDTKRRGLLRAGDPHGEIRLASHAKETLGGLYDVDCPNSPSATPPNSPTPTARPSCAA